MSRSFRTRKFSTIVPHVSIIPPVPPEEEEDIEKISDPEITPEGYTHNGVNFKVSLDDGTPLKVIGVTKKNYPFKFDESGNISIDKNYLPPEEEKNQLHEKEICNRLLQIETKLENIYYLLYKRKG